MKKFIIFIFSILLHTTCFAQYSMQIQGTVFNVELDDQKMTAAICDYKYKIDDSKYPISFKKRKINGINISERSRTLVIPESFETVGGKSYTITTIGKAAFAGYQNIDYVIIPSTVTTIEDYAFFRTSLINVEIPANVQKIGNRVFGWCKELKSIKLPQGLAMGNDLFSESKDINVSYYTANDLANESPVRPKSVKKTTPQVNKRKLIGSAPEVDDNLPVSSQQNEEVFAIIIANENYLNVARVDCALNDGRIFQRYCSQVLGIPDDNIHLIEDATFGQMTEQVNWLSRVAKAYEGDAKIIVYYAGHGIPNEKDASAYLLPIDNSGNNLAAAYSLKKLYDELGALNAKSVTLFMDACFSGAGRDDQMLTAARSIALASRSEKPKGNMVVFSAAQGDETAHPYLEKGHGLFTYYLLKKLKDTKGKVTFGELADYIKKSVSRKAIVANNKAQTPETRCSTGMENSWKGMTLK